jgi:hypothetical protein
MNSYVKLFVVLVGILNFIIVMQKNSVGINAKKDAIKSSLQTFPQREYTSSTPAYTLQTYPRETVMPNLTPKAGWLWTQSGCGSSAPCSYKVCSEVTHSCYSCRGFYDKNSQEGEKLPQPNENPTNTANFTCTKL